MRVTQEDEEITVVMEFTEYVLFAQYIRQEKESLEVIKYHPQYRNEYKMLEQLNHELTYPRQR